ncbi:MAG TPA: hypothetical protein PLM27_02320 [Chitinophagales bacterium]|nr:hypothetical protein [Chitinophagales bacterium]HNM30777.1 hypothetical protein [Chitinophagales bacterium]
MNFCSFKSLLRFGTTLLLFLPILLCAQDTIGYSEFRFTVIDVQGNELASDKITAQIGDIFLRDTTQADNYAAARVEYSLRDSCWILSQYAPRGYNYEIEIFRNSDTVNLRLLELRKMTLIYPGYNEIDQTGCQFCLCYDIPIQKGVYMLDVPQRRESWKYLRQVYINVRNLPTEFRDISAMQNWMFRSGK